MPLRSLRRDRSVMPGIGEGSDVHDRGPLRSRYPMREGLLDAQDGRIPGLAAWAAAPPIAAPALLGDVR